MVEVHQRGIRGSHVHTHGVRGDVDEGGRETDVEIDDQSEDSQGESEHEMSPGTAAFSVREAVTEEAAHHGTHQVPRAQELRAVSQEHLQVTPAAYHVSEATIVTI